MTTQKGRGADLLISHLLPLRSRFHVKETNKQTWQKIHTSKFIWFTAILFQVYRTILEI